MTSQKKPAIISIFGINVHAVIKINKIPSYSECDKRNQTVQQLSKHLTHNIIANEVGGGGGDGINGPTVTAVVTAAPESKTPGIYVIVYMPLTPSRAVGIDRGCISPPTRACTIGVACV